MPTLSGDTQAVLATDKVRFQGQEVAFVVAEDHYAARDALELIDVEYEPLPAVVDARRALDAGAPVVRDDLPGRTRTTTSSTGRPATPARTERCSATPRSRSARTCSTRGCTRRRWRPAASSRTSTRCSGQADGLGHQPGPARAPDPVRHGDRPARAQDPGDLAGHRRRVRQQGAHLSRLPVRDRRLDAHRPAGEVDGGPLGEPDVHLRSPGTSTCAGNWPPTGTARSGRCG